MALVEGLNEAVRGSARGSLLLMVGQVASTVVSALTVMAVARLLGPENYGVVTVVMVPIGLALLIQDLGVNTALTRFTALLRREGRLGDIRVLVRVGLTFKAAVAGTIALGYWAGAGTIASFYLQRPELEGLIRVVSLSVLGEALMTAVQAVLVGHEMMGYRSFTQVLWTVLRGSTSITLVWIGFGPLGHLVANTAAPFATAAVALIVLLSTLKKDGGETHLTSLEALRIILGFSLPLYGATLVGGGLTQIQNLLMTLHVPNSVIGNYSAAVNFGVLISFFTVPIATVLFPLFSRLPRGSPELSTVFRNSVKYTTFITLPVALCLVALSEAVIAVVYGGGYPLAAVFMKVYLILFLFEGIGGLSLGNLVVGVGEAKVALAANLLTVLVGAPMSLVLIPLYGIWGLLATLIVAPRVGALFMLWWVWKSLGFTVDWGASLRLYVAGLAAFLTASLALIFTGISGWAAILLGGGLFAASYLITVPALGALRKSDLDDLSTITDVSGPLKLPLTLVLTIMVRFVKE
ncbi:MAG: oligosaccharide flippase family protein [Candidatus Bathyarchaeota archaeon]